MYYDLNEVGREMVNTGKAFELEVKEQLEYELASGDLGIQPECAKVVHRKSYFSQQRQKPIIMDVVVEFYRPGSDLPFLEWIWECKDYTNKVPIDDLEEFHAKLEQIGVHSKKGTVVCRNGFQESVLSYAQNMGLGLARMLPEGSLVRVQEAIRDDTISSELAKRSLTQEPARIFFNSHFFGISCSGEGTNSLHGMLVREFGDLL